MGKIKPVTDLERLCVAGTPWYFPDGPEPMRAVYLYTDGGVILKNPSIHGGTWAYIMLDSNHNICGADSGVILGSSYDLPETTNNFTEMYALLRGLTALPDRWAGQVLIDSDITMGRYTGRYSKWNGIPEEMQEWAQRTRARIGTGARFHLIAGHPEEEHLRQGFRPKPVGNGFRNYRVSLYNVWCDAAATRAGEVYCRDNGIPCKYKVLEKEFRAVEPVTEGVVA